MKKLVLSIVLLAFPHTGFTQTLHMIGDSTLSVKVAQKYPETGWGQVLGVLASEFLTLNNCAKNGRSSKSFIDEGRWDRVKRQFKKGDYLLIQFGHNDQKQQDPARYTVPFGAYTDNLRVFIEAARSAGVEPILATSIVRRQFDSNGALKDTHKQYLEAVRQLAQTRNVPLVDMEQLTRTLVLEYGPEKSKQLFLHGAKGRYPNYPDGISDNTHLQETGALKVAALFVKGLAATSSSLNEFFK